MGEREAFSPEGWCQGGEGLASLFLLPKSLADSTNTPFQNSALYHMALAATGKYASAGAASARASSSDPQVPRSKALRVLALHVRKHCITKLSLNSLPSALQVSCYPFRQNTCLDPAALSATTPFLLSCTAAP